MSITRLRARAVRLNSRHAHREYPWSRTRRFISNDARHGSQQRRTLAYPVCHREERSDVAISLRRGGVPENSTATRLPRFARNDGNFEQKQDFQDYRIGKIGGKQS